MAKEEDYPEGCHRGKGKMLVLVALLIAVGMLGSAYILSTGNYAPTVNVAGSIPDHAISVSGTATQKVTPDLLQIQLKVQTEATDAKTSETKNAGVSSALLAKLKELGLDEKSVQTISYSMDPIATSDYVCSDKMMSSNCHYEYTTTGYQTTHTFNVDVEQLDKGGSIIDAATAIGTNETFVDYITFTLKDATKKSLETALLTQAAAAAKAKATAVASGMGVSVGNVLSASESYSYPVYNNYAYSGKASDYAAVPTQLSPGQLDVSATVSAAYAVK